MPALKNPFAGIECPIFWPVGMALCMEKGAVETPWKCLMFFENILKKNAANQSSEWATPNKIASELHTFVLRDFSTSYAKNEIPTLVLPPYAGHTSVIADFRKKQSLIETLLQNGLTRVFCADWRNATDDMKDYDIDTYLAEIHAVVCFLGGRVNLIGLCQGGWMAALYAARYPVHVAALVCAGSPIDMHAGNGVVRDLANILPMSFYENLVTAGNGLLRGYFLLEGFKSMHPEGHMMNKFISLNEYIDDPEYSQKNEAFERWYKCVIDLPGRWFLQVVEQLFKENRFAKGEFEALGQTVAPQTIVCPTYLLAGASDDITPQEQIFNAATLFGTP
ncbi:MAG: alpha/beta fold hydrolase, partial [Bdellovibrionales bacterium]